MAYHLLLGSDCNSYNTVTVSASVHALVQTTYFKVLGHDKSASLCILRSKTFSAFD